MLESVVTSEGTGRLAALAGRIPKKLYATASSPWSDVISTIPGE